MALHNRRCVNSHHRPRLLKSLQVACGSKEEATSRHNDPVVCQGIRRQQQTAYDQDHNWRFGLLPIVAKFPDLTRPPTFGREKIRHSVEHHIETTHGPPVYCKPRHLAPDRLAFLGHTVNAQGIKPLADRVKAINEASLPANIKALHRYLGMINFYRRFIPGTAKILQPLNDLLQGAKKGNMPITWSKEAKTSFSESKRALANATMLAHPIPDAPISLAVDASDFAIGAVLQQHANDTWQPLGFLTKPLNSAQRKYSAYDRELLAMYTAVKRFRHAVEGWNFIIFTDHKPLTYVFNQNPDKYSPRQFRQLDYIGQFTTDIR